MSSAARTAVRILRVAVALSLITFLAWKAGVLNAGTYERVSIVWFLLGFALIPGAVAIRALSLGLLLNRETRVLRFGALMRLTLVGAGLGLIVPMGAADLLKARYGLVTHGSAEQIVVSSVIDKLTSLTAVAAMGFAGALYVGDWLLTALAAGLFLASLVPTLLPSRRVWSALVRLLARGRGEVDEDAIMRHARPEFRVLARVYAVSVAGWAVSYTAVYAACRAAGAVVDVGTVFALAPLTTIARLVPISAGGLGVGEITLSALLAQAGVAPQIAALASLLQLLLLVLLPGATGLVVLGLGRAGKREA